MAKEMRLLALVLILTVGIANACIIEIREATFYPNGTQSVGRDWIVVNFTNGYGYEIYDVQIGEIAKIPTLLPGQNVKIDPYLELLPKEFPLVIMAKVEDLGERSRIEYVVKNFGKDMEILISFPRFEGFVDCSDCEVSERINFYLFVPSNSSGSFSITAARDFVIPDAEVGFKIEESQNLSFGFKIPISIEKGRGEKWNAKFQTSNPTDKEIEIHVNAWVDLCGEIREIFNESIKLRRGEVFSNAAELESACVPVFFFKGKAKAEDFCSYEIIPCYKFGESYIVGYAILKGFSYSPPASPTPTAPPVFPYTPPPPPIPPTAVWPEEVQLTGIVEANIPSTRTLPLRIKVEYAIMMVPATLGAFTSMFLFPVLNRRGVVASRSNAKILELLYPRFRIYTVPSNPITGGILVEPDEEVVSALLSVGLEREDAELIAVAIKIKKPIIARDRRSARVALACGVPVIGYGRS